MGNRKKWKTKKPSLTARRKSAKRRIQHLIGSRLKNKFESENQDVQSTSPGANISKPKEVLLHGRRIVDMAHILRCIQNLSVHKPFDCKFSDMEVLGERKFGLASKILIKCKMCNLEATISTENPEKENTYLNINLAAVSGMMATGGGYSQLQELCAALDMPVMTKETWNTSQERVCNAFERAAHQEMLEAGREEARLAKEANDVDEEGYPLITVVADGAWAKRSYKTKYDSLSGSAAIVGFRTKKVLHLEVRNKYCSFCDRYSDKTKIPEHKCYKNWQGTSTAMEADSIVTGFKNSVQIHGVKYARLIGDGDSSVHRRLIESLPYGPQLLVKKIECRNHILRNYSNRLREVCTKKDIGTVELRSLVRQNILRLRTAISKAVSYRKKQEHLRHEKIENLRKDIINGPSHVFGDHSVCSERGYFCNGEKNGEVNFVPQMKSTGIFQEVVSAVSRVAYYADSLIEDVDTNCVELYNSHIAKAVGGKRINYYLKQSYQGRCQSAVISYNTKGELHRIVHKTMKNHSPGYHTKKFTTMKKHSTNITNRRKRPNAKRCLQYGVSADEDYGPNAAVPLPDLPAGELEAMKTNYMEKLKHKCTQTYRDDIEIRTRGQSASHEWREERRKRLTASNFGRICKMRGSTSCASIVESIRYPTFSGNADTKWGIEKESLALVELSEHLQKPYRNSGLIVHEDYPFLGGSPDALIGSEPIAEIKCPASIKYMSPRDAHETNKLLYLEKTNDGLKLKRKNNFYYQVQGLLNISRRNTSYFVVWTPKGMVIDVIQKDVSFWTQKMVPKLYKFFTECVLPEILDSRKARGRPIRDPEYIEDAKKEAAKRRKLSDSANETKLNKLYYYECEMRYIRNKKAWQ